MRVKKFLLVLLAASIVIGSTACQDSSEPQDTVKVEGLDKLGEIQVISREKGSGTRSTFAQLADFQAESEDQADQTRTDAQIAGNAEEVIDMVSDDDAAIGYVSEGSIQEAEGMKQLKVEGIAADAGDKKYPLSRSFYLAYVGELNEVEEDFLTYIHGAGQEIVGKNYETVAKSSTFLSNKAGGTITINGSTSVAPLMEELAEAYMLINPNAKIEIEQSDSTEGLNQAMSGKCDFGMASRDLKDYEAELLDYEIIANDNIAVIVNEQNPLEDISLDTLKKIYTGDINEWKELNEAR
ncbi:MAG: substrate-binding domain-containing protein [Lachnospiraceae bacterium]